MNWNSEKKNNIFLLYSRISLPLPNNSIIINLSQLGQYKYETLMKFKGIIHLPYEASTMSIFEHISSEIPMFFPSKKFLKHLWGKNVIPHQMNYWKHNQNGIIPHYLNSTQNYDFWIERADYYDIEGYYYFDSFEHLLKILTNFKDELYEVRKEFIRKRKINIIDIYNSLNILN